jgi:RHS repeat-associated protein
MRRPRDRFPRNLKAVLGLEVLEDRVPVSENIGMLAMLATAGGAAALAPNARPLPGSARDGSGSPREVMPTRQIALITAKPSAPAVPQPAVVQPPAADFHATLRVAGLGDDPFAGLDQASFDLVGAFPLPPRHLPQLPDTASSPLAGPVFDSGAGVSLPPDALNPASPAGASDGPFLGSSGSAFDAVAAPLTATPAAAPATVPANPGTPPSNPPGTGPGDDPHDDHHHPPPGKGDDKGDPLYVLDARNALYLANNGTIHDFSGWYVSLYAQVSGATVQSYAWDTSNAPDILSGSISGANTYNLQFQWKTLNDANVHSDTIALQTTNTDNTHQNKTLYFAVFGANSQACQPSCTQPAAPTLPLVIPPDAVTAAQALITNPGYSLGEETGEVLTHFVLPSYHPDAAPLQLDYSSLAANPRPIFTEYYQLSQTVQPTSTVTATLKLNGVTQGTTTYDTHTPKLNQYDVLDIALQGDATGLSTGRYPYEIDVTEGTTITRATGNVDIISPSGSPFGAGWSLDGLEQVVPITSGGVLQGVILGLGNGQSLWFASLDGGSFQTPAGDFSTLTQSGSTYQRVLPDGTQINFNSAGYQTSLYDAIANQTFTYTYNGTKLISITDFQNLTTTLGYSGTLVTSIQDPVGRTTALAYSGSQLTSITDPNPNYTGETTPVFTFGYDSANKLSVEEDADSNLTTFNYDSLSGRINSVTRADTTTESLVPQQLNGLVGSSGNGVLAVAAGASYTDPRGKLWFAGLDLHGFGYPMESFDPAGDESIYHRDTNGLAWMAEDPLDRATKTFFDTNANPTKVVLPDGNYERYTYTADSTHQVASDTDPNGFTTTIGNVSGLFAGCLCTKFIKRPTQTASSTGPLGNPVYTFGWTANGLIESRQDPNSNEVDYVYDPPQNNRVTSILTTDDTGHQVAVTLGYNTQNYLTSSKDQLGNSTAFTVDNLGRTLATALPTGGVITATFDAQGNQLSLTDPLPLPGQQTDKTQFHFDAMNRVDRVTAPDGQVTTLVYDANGNMQDIYDPDVLASGRHRDRHFVYDDANRLITEQWLDGTAVDYTASYGYDAASQLTSASDNNSAYSFAYDSRGRQISSDNANTLGIPHIVLTSQYDKTGNRTEVSDSLGGTLTYSYDQDNNLAEIASTVSGATDQPVISFGYDLGARITSISRTTATNGNQVSTALTYTARNQVKTLAQTTANHPQNQPYLALYTYVYDAADNLSSAQEQNGPTASVTSLSDAYDPLNQLTGVTANNANYNESYSYTNAQMQDLNGNRSSASMGQGGTQTYGAPAAANRLTSDGQYTYTYDSTGNVTSKWGYENQVLTTYAYTWDFKNRLTEATKTQNGSAVADDKFTYDVFGRLIGKQVQGGSQTWTAYDGVNPYADFSGSTLTTRYVYGNGVDQLLAHTDASGNNTVWYVTDRLGSVRLIVGPDGSVQYCVSYYSFGGIVPGSQSQSGGDRFKFAGREWQSEVGLYNNRGRFYDPTTGRFLSEDPLQFAAGDPNLYRYVFNGPTVGTDPTGLLDSVSISVAQNPGLAGVLAETGVAGKGLLAVGGGGTVGLGVGLAYKALIDPAKYARICAAASAWIVTANSLGKLTQAEQELEALGEEAQRLEQELEGAAEEAAMEIKVQLDYTKYLIDKANEYIKGILDILSN